MSNIWFASDFHLGHRNIHKMRPEFASAIENDDKLCARWADLVTKRDIVYCLGDMAFDELALTRMLDLPGRKILVKGNHDVTVDGFELAIYDKILGLEKYKKMWLSHAPIHPAELRGKVNVHGHVHNATIPGDPRYFNICPEGLAHRFGRPMITLVELRAWIAERFPTYYTA